MSKTETDLQLLDASISHWERMREDRECGEKPGMTHCPLCAVYHKLTNRVCYGCPIAEYTGQGVCQGTPYNDAYEAFYDHCHIWQAAADRELAFLREVRDALAAKLERE